MNAYHSRLKTWMRRFNGVATKYLASYLGWRRLVSVLAPGVNSSGLAGGIPVAVAGELRWPSRLAVMVELSEPETTMTDDRMPLTALLQKAGEADFLRAVAESVLQMLMEADVEGLIGAGRHERSADRLNWRNGHRERTLDTRLGSLNLKIPKLRQGSYFPPFLEARKTTEKALVAVIQEAWIGGVSTRRVDELVQAMGRPD